MRRNALILIGLLLILAGVGVLLYTGSEFFNRESGAETHLPFILGSAAIGAGLIFVIVGSRHHIIAYIDRRRQRAPGDGPSR